jgi:hypothetical protein
LWLIIAAGQHIGWHRGAFFIMKHVLLWQRTRDRPTSLGYLCFRPPVLVFITTEGGPCYPFNSTMETSFDDSWCRASSAVSGLFKIYIILGAWSIWNAFLMVLPQGSPRPSLLLVRSARYGVWQEARGCPLSQPLAQIARLSRSGPFFYLLTFNERKCNLCFWGVWVCYKSLLLMQWRSSPACLRKKTYIYGPRAQARFGT